MAIERREPFREIMSLRETFNRLIDDAMIRPRAAWVAAFGEGAALDMYETDGKVNVEVALPGVDPKEVEVTTSDRTLVVKGERHTNEDVKEENYLHHEQFYGAFLRTVTLPATVDVDKPDASFKNGVLTVSFPKVATAQTKQIEVKV